FVKKALMKKHYLFTLFFFLTTLLLSGQIVPIETARQVAKNLYCERASLEKPVAYKDVTFTSELSIQEEAKAMYYVFNVSQDRGFVIVSAEKRTIPVLFYSFEGNYVSGNQPENFSYWLERFKKQITAVRQQNIQKNNTIELLWEKYAAISMAPAKDIEAVSPLVAANWGQDCFFNAACPSAPGGPCSHVYAGCVADAMAMVMKTHSWPTHGYGSHSYVHSTSNSFPNNYGTLSANFGNTTYNWSSMPNNVYSANSALATLMFHCGVSVNMSYDDQGSGALLTDATGALIKYFIYDAQYALRSSYSDTDWALMIKTDLDAGLPVIYGGSDTQSGGHAFVCDGYQGTGSYSSYFHFNWGWSGTSNGYVYLNNIAPSGTSYDFDDYQNIVYGIAPNTDVVTPEASFTANKTSLAINGLVVFTNSSTNNPMDYSWSISPSTGFSYMGSTSSTSLNPIVKFTVPGYYTISLTSTNSAGSDTETKTNYIYVYSTADVEEQELSKNIMLFPNPAQDFITIQTNAFDASEISLKVYDILGNSVADNLYSHNAGVKQIVVNLSSLERGLYFITLNTGKHSVTKKVILTK
ncbi:MAG TPA: C10 family peptidase, partial [Bacteroidales bacterium]|nr:C10 family peptidase [Bacteroidales bacterium]